MRGQLFCSLTDTLGVIKGGAVRLTRSRTDGTGSQTCNMPEGNPLEIPHSQSVRQGQCILIVVFKGGFVALQCRVCCEMKALNFYKRDKK